MNNEEYINNAVKTDVPDYKVITDRLQDPRLARFLHASMGLNTENAESQDILKKTLIYGKPLDEAHLKEELGDLFWYLGLICDTLKVSFEELQEANIAKLKARYGDKFTEEAALNRNLNKEKEALDSKA